MIIMYFRRLGVSYVAATLGATGTALGLNKMVKVTSQLRYLVSLILGLIVSLSVTM